MPKKILVVDDEEYICKVVSDLLSKEGYTVKTALNGKKGLEELKKEKVDLVLVDFFMPGMNGKEFCEAVRKDKAIKNSRLVFFTVALLSKKDYQDLEKLGVIEFIQKPFDGEFLIQKVKKILLDK